MGWSSISNVEVRKNFAGEVSIPAAYSIYRIYPTCRAVLLFYVQTGVSGRFGERPPELRTSHLKTSPYTEGELRL